MKVENQLHLLGLLNKSISFPNWSVSFSFYKGANKSKRQNSLGTRTKLIKINAFIQTSFSQMIAKSCAIFVLLSYSFDTQLMLILILTNVQYLQNAVFSFEQSLNRQNHSSSGSQHLVKKIPPAKFLITPAPLPLFGNFWLTMHCSSN